MRRMMKLDDAVEKIEEVNNPHYSAESKQTDPTALQ